MKTKIKEALKSTDISQVRAAVVELISTSPIRISSINEITACLSENPDIFQPDDGKFYASAPEDMTETLIESLHSDLKSNFSVEKLQLFAEVQAIRHQNHNYFKNRVSDRNNSFTFPDGTLEVEEHVTDGRISVANVSGKRVADMHSYNGPITDEKYERKATMVSKIGFAVIAAGAIAAIVGLCIPFHVLIGIGIGVILIGSTVVYTAISHRLIEPASVAAP